MISWENLFLYDTTEWGKVSSIKLTIITLDMPFLLNNLLVFVLNPCCERGPGLAK